MDPQASLMADEYDSLPDPFEGVDFDQVPELCGATDDRSDYDEFFDDIDPNELDRVPHLGPPQADTRADSDPGPRPESQQPPPPPNQALAAAAGNAGTGRTENTNASRSAPTSQAHSSAASTQYLFDEIDETFLQEVSVVEQAATGQIIGNTRSDSVLRLVPAVSSDRSLQSFSSVASDRITQRSSFKRKRSSAPATPSKRSKFSRTKSRDTADLHASARKVLDDMGEELTCPICYDVLVATYSTNPCGHSCCGECLLQWMNASRKPPPNHEPKCPICRTKLHSTRPVIPNIAMDNLVRRYVTSVAEVGKVDWQPTGDRYQTFVTRKEQTAAVAAQLRLVPPLLAEEEFWFPNDYPEPQPAQRQETHDDFSSESDEGSDEDSA